MVASGLVKGLRPLPRPKGWPVLGTLVELIASGGAPKLHKYVHKRHMELGPIYREKIGPVEGVFVSSPEYMRDIFAVEGRCPRHIIPESWQLYNETFGQKRGLLFMDDDEWLHFRKLLNGIILKPDPQILVDALTVPADDLVASWRTTQEVDNLEARLYNWSLQSIIAILLGAETYSKNKIAYRPMIDNLSKGIHNIFTESANLSLIPAKLAKTLRLPPWRRFVKAVQDSFKEAELLMTQLLKPDMLASTGLLSKLVATGMSQADLNRIVIDLILAAGDTTAYTTQWLLYLLAKHKSKQEAIYNDLKYKTNLDILSSPLVKGSLREALRLYPVAPFITRYLPADADIGGYSLHKEDLIIMSLYTSGRDDKSFPQADLFQPERWIRNGREYQKVVRPEGSLPFAMGPRSCIGRHIAQTQIMLTIAKIIEEYNVDLRNKKEVDINLHLITVPSEPIQLLMTRR